MNHLWKRFESLTEIPKTDRAVVIHGKVLSAISPKVQFPDADLWACTHTQDQYRKLGAHLDDWDEWWDYHPIDQVPWYRGIKTVRPHTWKWYRSLPAEGQPGFRPVWLMAQHPDVPASRRFPVELVRAAWPVEDEVGQEKPGGMWTCQVDYMMAWALMQGRTHIILHGHGVSKDLEHMIAHRGILYWTATARAVGCRVTILKPSWYRAPLKAYQVEAGGLPSGRTIPAQHLKRQLEDWRDWQR